MILSSAWCVGQDSATFPSLSQEGFKQRKGSRPQASVLFWACAKSRILWWIAILLCIRVGEATHPGPPGWVHFGIANSTGLSSKIDQVAFLEGSTWVFSETHLSALGLDRFQKGMRALQSGFTGIVPGAPCPQRFSENSGSYSGVLLLHRGAARAIPHQFPRESFATARLQTAGFLVGTTWFQVGMLYGFPKGASHSQPEVQTDMLLEMLVDRLACGSTGPRLLAGDFNHSLSELSQLQRLHGMGWRECQEIAALKWGVPEKPTGKGQSKIDQVWLSPELVGLLREVSVLREQWPDHATVEIQLEIPETLRYADVWSRPRQLPWPKSWTAQVSWNRTRNPTESYAELWSSLERAAIESQCEAGVVVQPGELGRGQTLQPKRVPVTYTPLKASRRGELQPEYYGVAKRHALWWKQLRRAQVLARLLNPKDAGTTEGAWMNARATWAKMLQAPGFDGNFLQWWAGHGLQPCLAGRTSVILPTPAEAQELFDSFQVEVRRFERTLNRHRIQLAKKKRSANMKYVFADCRGERPKPIDSLMHRLQDQVEEVDPDEAAVVLSSDNPWRSTAPVVIEGIPRQVIAASQDKLWLDSVDDIAAGQQVVQEDFATSDQDIIAQLKAVWEPRWIKLNHVAPSQWKDIQSFAERVLPPVVWDCPDWTALQVADQIKLKKANAGIGPDGVSKADLAALPDSGLQALADLYAATEQGASWPLQTSTGFVQSLAKCSEAVGADQYRPVTVYSLVYRVWSSVRSRQALVSFEKILPPSVQGGCPFRQARNIWMSVARRLEHAYQHSLPLVGLVLDIRKAFNCIPRWPIWFALKRMNFPDGVLQSWCSFVTSQTRRFCVRTSVSDGIPSTVGLPEGCGLSVFGMTVIDYLFDLWVKAAEPSAQVYTFVDDWQILAQDPAQLERAWTSIEAFAKAVDFSIDEDKTFSWAAHSSERTQLRGGRLKLQLASKVLGVHHNFCRRAGNRTIQNRIASMQSTWTRLRASSSPYRHKVGALLVMAWPKALHGVSVVHLGRQHYVGLRSSAMKGLRVNRKGANPMMRLATHGLVYDPEAWSLLQTLRDIRELGDSPELRHDLQSQGVDPVRSNGPIGILLARVAVVGWTLHDDGCFEDSIGRFDLFHISWEEVVLRVKLAWPQVLSDDVIHRSSFDGVHRCDMHLVQALLKTYEDSDQTLLRCHLDGTLYTQNGRANISDAVSSQCPWCDQKDGFHHRAWDCSFFQEDRMGMTEVLKSRLEQSPRCTLCHGWPVEDQSVGDLRRELCQMPEPQLGQRLVSKDLPEVFNLFVDGACTQEPSPSLRLASWAVTWADPDVASLDHSVIGVGHVPGLLQTSFRGELWAVLMAIQAVQQAGVDALVWCDNDAVVRGLGRLLRTRRKPKPSKPHFDLWSRVWSLVILLRPGQLRVQKVLSHGDLASTASLVEQWAFWHNGLADKAAAGANVRRPDDFMRVWQAAKSSVVGNLELMKFVFKVHLHTAKRALNSAPSPPDTHPSEAVVTNVGEADLILPQAWQWTAESRLRFGDDTSNEIQGWWQSQVVPWLTGNHRFVWVTWCHLFLHFLLFTGSYGPRYAGRRWVGSTEAFTDQGRMTFMQRTRSFQLCVRQFLTDSGFQSPGHYARGTGTVIQVRLNCLRLRVDAGEIDRLDGVFMRLVGALVRTPKQLDVIGCSPLA
eukprot:Skav204951  [mRNA]  locus=scaffold3104:98266:103272:- [translate_table: standard]